MFVHGQVYIRRELHSRYSGQAQGGISTPSAHDFLMLFTGEQGQQYGYKDGWTSDGIFLYTGEGQVGNMEFVRGNRAIRDHLINHKDLHLFKYEAAGQVRYVNQMICAGHQLRQALDKNGNLRQVIVFELVPVSALNVALPQADQEDEELWTDDLASLRQKAIASSGSTRDPVERRALTRLRSSAIRIYVLRRAQGICEACGRAAPFSTDAGRPYLEPHHIKRLSDGGPDHPDSVAAVCPNCHRRAHYSADRAELNGRLAAVLRDRELKAVTCR